MYEGLNERFTIDGNNIHLYCKKNNSYRKIGHVIVPSPSKGLLF